MLSPSDPAAAWTAKAHLQVQFAYGLNYLIDMDNAIIADTAYGTGAFLGWLVGQRIAPHIPVWDKSQRQDGTLSRQDFRFDKKATSISARRIRSWRPPAGCMRHDAPLPSQQI